MCILFLAPRLYVHIHMCVCVCVCVYIYIYIHIYTEGAKECIHILRDVMYVSRVYIFWHPLCVCVCVYIYMFPKCIRIAT